MKHYKFGGSTMERTLACPAWQYLSAKLPPRPAGDAAKKGTALHHLFEKCIRDLDYEPEPGVYEVYDLCELDFAEKLYPALDALDELKERYKITTLQPEVEVSLNDEIGGTADVIGIGEVDGHKVLVIADLKTGDGVMVDAEKNKQLMFYAACALHACPELCADVKLVCLAIIQPSHRRPKMLETSLEWVETIREFQGEIHEAVAYAREFEKWDVLPEQKHLGDHCTWCPAAATCPAQLERAEKNKGVKDFTAAELSVAMSHVDGMKAWIKEVEAQSSRIARDGGKIDGFKLVKGRCSRHWSDAEKVADIVLGLGMSALIDDCYRNEFRSVAQVEKAFKVHGVDIAYISDYVSRSGTGINFVPDSHASEAYDPNENSMAAKIQAAIADKAKANT